MDSTDHEAQYHMHDQTRAALWYRTPAEVRLLILEAVSRRNKTEPTKTRGYLAGCASVCREWQNFFEKINFSHVALHQNDFEAFGNVARCRDLIQHIWLRIELAPYDCSSCSTQESLVQTGANNRLAEKAVLELFAILSRWREGRDQSCHSLTLEISAHSPSDSQHHFPDHIMQSVDSACESHERPAINDLGHGWLHNHRFSAPSPKTIDRHCGNLLSLDFRWKLATVNVVKHILVRRQHRRCLWPETLQSILRCLPQLESMQYETWRRGTRSLQGTTDEGYVATLSRFLPPTLKNLTVFEDANHDFVIASEGPSVFHGELTRTPSRLVAAALAQRSLSLETLSASFLIDAYDFFEACPLDQDWKNLKSIALTSQHLRLSRNGDFAMTKKLLLLAAAAAERMPKLRTMELWDGGHHHAALFRYHATTDYSTVSWRSTCTLELDAQVVEAWGRVAVKHTRRELSVQKAHIISAYLPHINTHGEAILYLELKAQVAHPVSVLQMRQEGAEYFYPWCRANP